ncbi:hypothetical protein B0H15DRAFT_862831 [Mycena belliarum]|uniref:Secreted protein n=1 Tax=Mycena belliarum TaxID=1033014 RepID=A0AAD6TRQ6_9AGAR|nr:hypothetical protein B0H15DRAFT_862831 [Mycena belliae]
MLVSTSLLFVSTSLLFALCPLPGPPPFRALLLPCVPATSCLTLPRIPPHAPSVVAPPPPLCLPPLCAFHSTSTLISTSTVP